MVQLWIDLKVSVERVSFLKFSAGMSGNLSQHSLCAVEDILTRAFTD